jgi:hypothetical protein
MQLNAPRAFAAVPPSSERVEESSNPFGVSAVRVAEAQLRYKSTERVAVRVVPL